MENVISRNRKPKYFFTQEQIVQETLTLIHLHGLEYITLRRVADRLKTGAATLYAHIESREHLLELAFDSVYMSIPIHDPATGDWKEKLTTVIEAAIVTFIPYPGLATIGLGRVPKSPGALRLIETLLVLMIRGGIPDYTAALGVDLLSQFILVSATEQSIEVYNGTIDPHFKTPLTLRDHFHSLPQELYPNIARLAETLTFDNDITRRRFAIRVLIEGLQHNDLS